MPGRSNVKSMVWYSPSAFADGGYEIPTDARRAEGALRPDRRPTAARRGASAPSPASPPAGCSPTGWRTSCSASHGPEVYDQWVNHEIPFNDPRSLRSPTPSARYVKNPDYLGARRWSRRSPPPSSRTAACRSSAATATCTARRTSTAAGRKAPTSAPRAVTSGSSTCRATPTTRRYMLGGRRHLHRRHRQARDVDVIRHQVPRPALRVRQLPRSGSAVAEQELDISAITDPYLKAVSELQTRPTCSASTRSDLMPGAVGSGTLLDGDDDWVIGGESHETFVDNVEASWPRADAHRDQCQIDDQGSGCGPARPPRSVLH